MILAIYDLSGIQSFIFATNKLKEMIGGSLLVSRALFENIPKALEEEPKQWAQNEFKFSEKDKAKTVYIGGGNALVAYDCVDTYEKNTAALQKEVFLQTGGALKLCSACIEADISRNLSEILKDLMNKLDENKKSAPFASTAKGFSINAHDNETFEPVILVEEKFYYSKSRYLKKAAAEANKDDRYETELNKFFVEGEKRAIAVIHIDGNTMGIRIRNFVNGMKDGNLISQLERMRVLSIEIGNAYKSVLNKTVAGLDFGCEKNIPFRPIIADGDDITVICRSFDAFPFVKAFAENLKSKTINFGEGESNTLSIGAGLVFVNVGFPFCTAYDIAEQLCKNAKFKALECKEFGKSSVDFQVCTSGMTTSVNSFRRRSYDFKLKRPYIFDVNDATNDKYDFEKGFWSKKKSAIESGIARSKLKGLRNEYGKGVLAANTYADYLKAKDTDNHNLGEPFTDDGYAELFDILDVMDHIKSKEEEQQ